MTFSEMMLLAIKAGTTVLEIHGAVLLAGSTALLIEKIGGPANTRRLQVRAMLRTLGVLVLVLVGTWWEVRL